MLDRAARAGFARVSAARGQSGGVEGAHCFAPRCLEACRPAVSGMGWRAIQRAQDQQFGQFVTIADALIEEVAKIADAQWRQHGVIETLRPLQIVGAEANMGENAHAAKFH